VALGIGLCLLATGRLAAAAPAAAIGKDADAAYRAGLGLVYDGSFAAAEARLAELASEQPADPVAPYLQALALEWRLEQRPDQRALDPAVLALADRALALAAAALARDPADARALLARGAAHGVKSRLFLFRWERRSATREALDMREALTQARARGVRSPDLDFGLGLYDYYADTLPRFFRLFAFLLGIPGGDRQRGLEQVARAAHGGSLFHDDEARAQMYDIESYFEHRPDRALPWIRELRGRYPGWPLWGLKLAGALSELGLFAESAAVAEAIEDTAARARHPNYGPLAAAMAAALRAEALLLDLRPGEARAEARRALGAADTPAWVRGRALLVEGKSLELEGQAAPAREAYAAAEATGDPPCARAAREALAAPLPAAAASAMGLLARARRAAENGDPAAARRLCLEAHAAFPRGDEGRLCAAQEDLAAGRAARAEDLARALVADAAPWLRPEARLVLAAALERRGRAAEAVTEYGRVWEEPYGRADRRTRAADALRRLGRPVTLPTDR